MKPVLLIDVDGVIANFTQFYVDCAINAGIIQRGSIPIGWEPSEWNIGESLGLTRDGRSQVWREMSRPGSAQSIELYPDAREAVLQLSRVSEIYFPTSPIYESPSWEYDRYKWFCAHFGSDLAERLIFTKCKEVIFGHILIDDKPENLSAWKKRWGCGTAVLWPHLYNADGGDEFARPGWDDWDWVFDEVKAVTELDEDPRWIRMH